MRRAFGAEELGRYTAPDGVVAHTTVKVGNAYMEMGEAHDAYEPMPTMFYCTWKTATRYTGARSSSVDSARAKRINPTATAAEG